MRIHRTYAAKMACTDADFSNFRNSFSCIIYSPQPESVWFIILDLFEFSLHIFEDYNFTVIYFMKLSRMFRKTSSLQLQVILK